MEESLHIGDGIYVSFDGYNIWIAVNHHQNKVACLEPGVFEALVIYRAELKKKYVASGHLPEGRGILG